MRKELKLLTMITRATFLLVYAKLAVLAVAMTWL